MFSTTRHGQRYNKPRNRRLISFYRSIAVFLHSLKKSFAGTKLMGRLLEGRRFSFSGHFKKEQI